MNKQRLKFLKLSKADEKIIDKHVNKIVRSFIPIGYWVYPDGEHIALSKTPFKITQKIYLKFGVKYKEFYLKK